MIEEAANKLLREEQTHTITHTITPPLPGWDACTDQVGFIHHPFCTAGITEPCFLSVHRYGLILSQKKGGLKAAALQKPSVFGDDSDDEVGKLLDS